MNNLNQFLNQFDNMTPDQIRQIMAFLSGFYRSFENGEPTNFDFQKVVNNYITEQEFINEIKF